MWLTLYILVWPAISAVILLILVANLARDLIEARKSGKSMI
ncbi:putative transporter small subunit [Alcaligenes sp. Marseille-Q7550]